MSEGKAKILVVDDDDANRYVKTHVLRRRGYHLFEAAQGADAIAIVQAESPALVLLDVKLPDIDGFEVCRRIKAANSGTIVLQTSAALTKGIDRAAGLQGGADSYLIEPIEPDELVATVTALLRLQQAERDLRSLNETLEQRVVERTRALADANSRLALESDQRSKAEEALRHAQKLDALGQLTGGVAHDFNNLLTVVLGNLEIIQQGLLASPPMAPGQIGRLVAGALRAAGNCERLTRQLLAFARRDMLRLDVVDLNAVLGRFDNLLRRALGESVTLSFQAGPDLWLCRVDASQFEAAVLNLAVNARQAMPEGGEVRIATGNVEIGAAALRSSGPMLAGEPAPGKYVCLTVSDTGHGMTQEVLAHAFEPFFTTKDVGEGSGLGLSQVYGFVRQSNGHLTVDTIPGSGTTFSLYLPRSEDAVPWPPPTASAASAVPRGTEIILIVEDNDMVRDLAVAMIGELGYGVLIAADGPAALAVLAGSQRIDLLFSDVVMPNRMSGIELAREAQRLRPGLRLLLTSGYAARGGGDVAAGEFPLIRKPYRRPELAQRLRQALDR